MKWLLLLLLGGFCAGPLPAQDTDRPQRPPHGKWGAPAERPGERFREGMRQRIAKRLAEIKAQDPEKYEALIKLQKEDPRKFHQELFRHAAAQKHKPGEGFSKKGRRPGRGRHGFPRLDELMEHLRQRDPERWEQIRKLREEDPEQAHAMMRDFVHGFRRKYFGGDDAARKLAKEYREAENEDRKGEIEKQLRELVEKSFDERRRRHAEQIKQMIARLQAAQQKLKQMEQHKQAICDKRVRQLLSGDPLPPKDQPQGPRRKEPRPAEQQ